MRLDDWKGFKSQFRRQLTSQLNTNRVLLSFVRLESDASKNALVLLISLLYEQQRAVRADCDPVKTVIKLKPFVLL